MKKIATKKVAPKDTNEPLRIESIPDQENLNFSNQREKFKPENEFQNKKPMSYEFFSSQNQNHQENFNKTLSGSKTINVVHYGSNVNNYESPSKLIQQSQIDFKTETSYENKKCANKKKIDPIRVALGTIIGLIAIGGIALFIIGAASNIIFIINI